MKLQIHQKSEKGMATTLATLNLLNVRVTINEQPFAHVLR